MSSEYQGVDGDLRNLFRPGSGLTLRRLVTLIRGLSPDSALGLAMAASEVDAQKATADQIKAAEARFRERNARAKEAG